MAAVQCTCSFFAQFERYSKQIYKWIHKRGESVLRRERRRLGRWRNGVRHVEEKETLVEELKREEEEEKEEEEVSQIYQKEVERSRVVDPWTALSGLLRRLVNYSRLSAKTILRHRHFPTIEVGLTTSSTRPASSSSCPFSTITPVFDGPSARFKWRLANLFICIGTDRLTSSH